MLEDDSSSQAVDAGDTPGHLGAAVPPPRRDPHDLDHLRAGLDEFLDLEGWNLEGSGELADVAAEPLVAPIDLAEHLAGGRHDLSIPRLEGDELGWEATSSSGTNLQPSVAQAPDDSQPL